MDDDEPLREPGKAALVAERAVRRAFEKLLIAEGFPRGELREIADEAIAAEMSEGRTARA